MKLCPKNHYYDSERYSSCPYCDNNINENSSNNDDQQQYKNLGETESINESWNIRRNGKTESIWDNNKNDKIQVPRVVGWLVCTSGNDYGRDFRLHVDNNFVGRDIECDICLNDSYVSRKHFTVTYDPLNDNYFATMSEGRGIVYVNKTPLMPNQILKQGDKIKVGKTELVFVPLKSSIVNWNWEQV